MVASYVHNGRSRGNPFVWMVRICGAAGIASFFLPWFNDRSGFSVIRDLLTGNFSSFGEYLTTAFSDDKATRMGTFISLFLMAGLFIFLVVSVYMIITGKYEGAPLTFIIVFTAAVWALLQFAGHRAEIYGGILAHSNYGYWVSVLALFIPFPGMFIFDKRI